MSENRTCDTCRDKDSILRWCSDHPDAVVMEDRYGIAIAKRNVTGYRIVILNGHPLSARTPALLLERLERINAAGLIGGAHERV